MWSKWSKGHGLLPTCDCLSAAEIVFAAWERISSTEYTVWTQLMVLHLLISHFSILCVKYTFQLFLFFASYWTQPETTRVNQQRKQFNTMWNVNRFFIGNSFIDHFSCSVNKSSENKQKYAKRKVIIKKEKQQNLNLRGGKPWILLLLVKYS